ncbi:Signal transduction histidine kinase [Nocardioides exalbidus]|uniref:histidine kinase n=1 Tax=Nocardioides exalbidus TaxID=402596 RepID=A0A1H4I3B4_9ACTN|nr:histidine kinase [Nocardioides exalbidus]SEB28574.1 Signal transduction histidine kinase [Nocardioides exalbidus]
MLTLVRSLWRLPAPADAGPAGRWDHAFVVAVAVAGIVEATVLRPEMHDRWIALAAFIVWLPTLLVRRTKPMLMVGVFFMTVFALWLRSLVTGDPRPDDLNSAVVGLLIPFSLARWARGKQAVEGLLLFWLAASTSLWAQDLAMADQVGGTAVVIAAIAVGASLRTRSQLRSRELDDVRQQERERLARDLHDTVAHHLTAIAISAQAGLAVADDRPGAAKDALRRIDEEATRTLAETREVVRMLRTDDEAPDRPLDDLAGLATAGGPGPSVEVTVADGIDDLSPTVAAAVHRIAQEAVANARRHAVGVTSVQVSLDARHDDLTLTVTDDGTAGTKNGAGFGIVGMTERAALLGGRLEAGPGPAGGWQVVATLPTGVRR